MLTIPMISAKRLWHAHAVEMMNELHKFRTRHELREYTGDFPLLYCINKHMAPWGVTATLDHSKNRDLVFFGPTGVVLDHLKCSYLLYSRIVRDQNEHSIVKFWDV